MATYWEEADDFLINLVEGVIDEHHDHLKNAKIGLLYRNKAQKSGDKFVYGKARKVSEKDKVFMDFDFIIWIAKEEFNHLEYAVQKALVDHELCHCWGWPGGWKMRHHDVEEFIEIVCRHGIWRPDLKFMQKAFEATGKQLPLMSEEPSGSVASVPKSLLERAKEDPDAVAAELYKEAELLKAENGGKITIVQLQRKLRIGYTKAAAIKELLDSVSG